jgi:hypothetical protein
MPARSEPHISLLNSEGDILTLYKINENAFGIADRKKVLIALFSREDVLRFVEGEGDIVDSEGESWHYPDYSLGMKPSEEKLSKFLNS